MRGKIDVVDTATFGLTFGGEKLWAFIRLGFFPILLSGLTTWYFNRSPNMDVLRNVKAPFLTDALVEASGNLFNILVFFGAILSFFLWIPISVLFIRAAAGQIALPKGFLYFRWTARETRFLLMILFSCIWFAGIGLLIMAPAIYLNTDGDVFTPSGAGIAAMFLGAAVFIWVAIRSSLFLSVVAIENRLAPFYAFGLTGGNFWRILGVYALLMLAVFAVTFISGFVFLGMGIAGNTVASLSWLLAVGFIISKLFEIYAQLVSLGLYGRLWQGATLTEDAVDATS